MMLNHSRRRQSVGLFALALLLTAGSASGQSIGIPSYVQPGSATWQSWAAYPQSVKIMIVNLNNGDDLAFQPAVQAAVQTAQTSGIRVFGYTYTRYGQRDPEAVRLAIDAARLNYAVDGIFFDEAPTSCTSATPFAPSALEYYQNLSGYVRSFGGSVVLNPGTAPSTDCWMGVADTLVTYENAGISNYVYRYTEMAWMRNYPANRFWHLLYAVKQQKDMQTAFKLAKQRNAGFVYVTSDGDDGNPWDGIPSYWSAEVRQR